MHILNICFYKTKRAFWQGDLDIRRERGFHFSGFWYNAAQLQKEGTPMTLAMYILIGVILVAFIYFIIKGKK